MFDEDEGETMDANGHSNNTCIASLLPVPAQMPDYSKMSRPQLVDACEAMWMELAKARRVRTARKKWHGHTASELVRALYARGWKDIHILRTLVDGLHLNVAMGTVQQLKYSRETDKVADLSRDDYAELEDLRGAFVSGG
jgi:hypothetical protein